MMLVTETLNLFFYGSGGHLPVGSGDRDELAAEKFFGGCGLIHIDMGKFSAEDGVKRAGECLQSHNVGPGAVVNQKYFCVVAKKPPEVAGSHFGIGIRPVGGRVSVVRLEKGLHDSRVYAGIIVTCKRFLVHTSGC